MTATTLFGGFGRFGYPGAERGTAQSRDDRSGRAPSAGAGSWRRTGVLALALVAGCVASQQPLGPPGEAVVDARLVGGFTSAKSPEISLQVVPRDGGKSLLVVYVDDSEKQWAVFSGHATALGERRFLNLELQGGSQSFVADARKNLPDPSYRYSFVTYSFTDDGALSVGLPSPEAFTSAIRAGRLAGKTEGKTGAFLESDSAAIAAYLGEVPEKDLFQSRQIYRRK